jgi:hypothetical protein
MQSVSSTSLGLLLVLAGCGGASSATRGPTDPGITIGPPASIVIYAGNSQTGVAGTELSDPLCTNVRDAAGHLLVGVVVTYTVATGGGRVANPSTPATDASGIARSGTWTLGTAVGTQTVTASSPGAGSITFSAVAH